MKILPFPIPSCLFLLMISRKSLSFRFENLLFFTLALFSSLLFSLLSSLFCSALQTRTSSADPFTFLAYNIKEQSSYDFTALSATAFWGEKASGFDFTLLFSDKKSKKEEF